MKHVTTLLKIGDNEVPIDNNILDIVKWLNSFQSVVTEYSCEGGGNNHPYVLFRCNSDDSLQQILTGLYCNLSPYDCIKYGDVVIDWHDGLRYELKFDHEQMRDCFTKFLVHKTPFLPVKWKRYHALAEKYPLVQAHG